MDRSHALKLYHSLLRIRRLEEEIAKRYAEQEMRCPVHLSVGQEATPVALCDYLSHDDKMVSTHRGHAHYLAKGGSAKALVCELYGKREGCSKGQGGSMHLVDHSVGFVGSTSIVGGTTPIGVGVAFAQHLQGKRNLTAVCIGDTAVEEGVVHESFNFASLHKLPVIFVCENNFYSCYSPLKNRQPNRPLVEVGKGHGMKSIQLDGMDVYSMHAALGSLIEDVRTGQGPLFLELSTYRYLEHCGPNNDDNLKYRPDNEIAYWRDRDSISIAKNYLLSKGYLDDNSEKTMIQDVDSEIMEIFSFAKSAPFPDPNELGAYIYAG